MNGLATGATIMISRYFGAKDKEGLHCAVRTALLLAGILGIVCAVAGVIFLHGCLISCLFRKKSVQDH